MSWRELVREGGLMNQAQDDEVVTIYRDLVQSKSTFRIKDKEVAIELQRKGFVLVTDSQGEYVLQATGKWSHRKTRSVVHRVMSRHCKDPLARADAVLSSIEKGRMSLKKIMLVAPRLAPFAMPKISKVLDDSEKPFLVECKVGDGTQRVWVDDLTQVTTLVR